MHKLMWKLIQKFAHKAHDRAHEQYNLGWRLYQANLSKARMTNDTRKMEALRVDWQLRKAQCMKMHYHALELYTGATRKLDPVNQKFEKIIQEEKLS